MRGHKRALTDVQVLDIREAWWRNNQAWHIYRSNPNRYNEPMNLKLQDLATRYRVSAGVIQHVIDRKGAYTDEPIQRVD